MSRLFLVLTELQPPFVFSRVTQGDLCTGKNVGLQGSGFES